jgi:hypothetical protein
MDSTTFENFALLNRYKISKRFWDLLEILYQEVFYKCKYLFLKRFFS